MPRYNIYMKSRNLGIRLGASDLDIDSVNAFNVIGAKLNEIQEAKDKLEADKKPKVTSKGKGRGIKRRGRNR